MAKETKRIVGGAVRELTVQEAAQHSLELAQNAKGELSFSVKLYATDEQLPDLANVMRLTVDRLQELFPQLALPVPHARIQLKQVDK